MSLVRATTRACPRAAHTTARAQRRNASDHAGHDAHHHDEHAVDTTVYPKEDFLGRNWMIGGVLGLGAYTFYKFGPATDGSAGLTHWIQGLRPEGSRWTEVNAKHLDLAFEDIAQRRTTQEAALPPTHRYRFPQSFEMVSPHLAPVGPRVDLSNLVVKRD